MAEHVTNANVTPGSNTVRLRGLFARFPGGPLEARGGARRDTHALFQILKASRGRLPVTRVTRHVCQHDQGVGACTVDQEG